MPGTNLGPDLYDAALSALRKHVDGLGGWLAIWEARAQDGPDAHARRCANHAMDAIDAMLRDLHAVRAQLTGEIRADDDATAARVDVLLAEDAGTTTSGRGGGPTMSKTRRKRSGYYRPMSGRRLRRYLWRRLVPWPVRWLFGWR